MSYLKFLNLVKAVRQLPAYPAMDAIEARLINELGLGWAAGKQTSVVEAMNMLDDVSPSSVHRRLKTLTKKGLIKLVVDKVDSRVKYIVGTPLYRKYLAEMDACLLKAQE